MADTTPTPLEAFLLDYIEQAGGMWDRVEPQVYDVVVPEDALGEEYSRDVVRLVLDPEAVSDHAGASFLGFGTPLADELFERARQRGAVCRAHVGGLNLHLGRVAAAVDRNFRVDRPIDVKARDVRPMDFPQALFWFEATLTGDQTETHTLPIAIDMHWGREVRHLDRLLDPDHLRDAPELLLPQAKRCEPAEAHELACRQVMRSVGAIAGARNRDFLARMNRQIRRIESYYADLREELRASQARAARRGSDTARYAARLAATDREEQLRIAELRRNSRLTVRLRTTCLLILHHPKLMIELELLTPSRSPLTWPLV